MAVAALDTYMHRLILERAYTHVKLPGALARLDVSFVELLTKADELKAAARAKPHQPRPRVAVKRQLRDRLLRETFQSYEDVSRALGMAGRSGSWDAIGQGFSPTMTPSEIKTRLSSIVIRRNQIVHEGDYKRLERPQRASRNGLSQKDAAREVTFLSDLIDAIHSAI
jgi:hypothetical protein